MPHRLSLLSHRLDRVTHVAYFLGAVVPLGALASIVMMGEQSAVQRLGWGLMMFVACVATLSLACFLLLRSITRRALERMDADSQRLAMLLNASTALTTTIDGDAAASVAATYAARLAGARAAFVVSKGRIPGRLKWSASAGADAEEIALNHAAHLEMLARSVVDQCRPAMRRPSGDDSADWIAPTTVAVPFVTDSGMAVAALIVVHGEPDGCFEPAQLDGLLTLAGLASVALANAELRLALQHRDVAEVHERVPAGVM